LYRGIEPEPTYPSEAFKKEVEEDRPHEIRTAKRIATAGLRSDFREDEESFIDEEKGLDQVRGYADFADDLEIKTLQNAATYNTINGYIKNTSRKKRC
jgi:hypothetical protein